MAKPLLSPLPLFLSDSHLLSQSQARPLAIRTPRPRTHSGRQQASSSSRRSRRKLSKRRAPSAAVLAILGTLATEQARAYNLKAAAAASFPLSTAEEPLLQCSDVPEFLCPTFVTTITTTSSLPVASSSSSISPDTRTKLEGQQQEQYEKGDEGDTTANWPAEDLVVARSTSPITTHSLLSAANPFFTLEDFGNNNKRNLDENTGASRQSIFGRRRSEFSFRPREDKTGQEAKREKRDLLEKRDTSTTATSTDTVTATATSPECSELYTSRTIPDRYELGNDGRWHKLSISSSCSLCDCTSPEVDNAVNNDLSPTGDSNEALDPSSSATLSASDSQDTDAFSLILPDGWDRTHSSAVYRVPLIVVASLLVAATVTVAVWITFFWRRRRKEALCQALARDLEKRKKAEGVETESEGDYEDDGSEGGDVAGEIRGGRRDSKGVRVEGRREKKSDEKARTRWMRGAAQWKAYVRWSHRRKRGRSSVTVGGGKDQQQRTDAISSGISLARSTTSSRAGSSTAGDRCTHGARGSADDGGGNEVTTAGESWSDTESASPPQSGLGSGSGSGSGSTRASTASLRSRRGSVHERASQPDSPLRHPDITSDRCGAQLTSEHRDEPCQRPGASPTASHNLRSTSSTRLPAQTSDSPPPRVTLSAQSRTSSEYDRPPPDILHRDDETQEPPAYRSRRSDDILNRRRRRDEKGAVTSGYVPAPEDCASYSSGDEGGNESEREGRSSTDSGRLLSGAQTSIQMHVAVDDKRALARLAAYASSPPVPSSPQPPPSLISPSPCSPPLPYSLFEPNAPPEPEWEQFEDSDYARALGLSGAGLNVDDSRDSPGAGPGPSTVYVRSRSVSPVSCSGSSARASTSRSEKTDVRSPSYSLHYKHQHQHHSFPAPPAPVSSQLAYAPADAGLVPLPDLPRLPSFNFGYDHDDFVTIPLEGPSAPPFSPYDDHAHVSYTPRGGEDGLIGGPSAPPLFSELGDDGYRAGPGRSTPSVPSAPLEDEVESDGVIDTEADVIHSSTATATPISLQEAEDEEASRQRLPEIVHGTTNDRNAMPSAVR